MPIKFIARMALAIVTPFVLAAPLSLVSGCGGKEPEKQYEDQGEEWDATHFSVVPEVNRYYGLAPFTAKFWTTVQNADGPVKFEWTFGDGTTSVEAAPTHTFTKPGLYTIGVAGTNPKGERDGGVIIVRSETPEEAEKNRAAEEGANEAERDGSAPGPDKKDAD